VHFRTVSDSPSRRAVDKCTKKSQDVGGSSSQAKKPCACKVILRVPPLVPSDEEEEQLPFQVHSPIEEPSSHRTQANYMREDSRAIINQCNIPYYESAKESPDPHFWSYFHMDWYRSVHGSKLTPVVPMQWTYWAFLEKHKKDCHTFKDVIDMCKYHGLEKIMAFRYDWNEEVILQFYSTFFFHKNNTGITWMTDGTKYSISIGQFASILGLGAYAKYSLNLQDGNVLELSQMASMYGTPDFTAPTITNFKPEMVVLHRVIRKTLAPREGDSSRVPQFERNLLKAITEKTKFNAFDFIIQEMLNIAIANTQSCACAPYIMALIETVSKRTFVKDVEHTPPCPKKQFSSLPPSAVLIPPAASTSSDEHCAATTSSSSGRLALFKMFKSLFSISQSNNQELAVSHEHQEVLLENQQNIHQKMQVEQRFVEFHPVEAPPHL
jgi:hypothetical protein